MLGEICVDDDRDTNLDAFLKPTQHIASDDPGIVEYRLTRSVPLVIRLRRASASIMPFATTFFTTPMHSN